MELIKNLKNEDLTLINTIVKTSNTAIKNKTLCKRVNTKSRHSYCFIK